jgi:membrane-bound metal-dependent hydrolase YbcI (DUF457 family)
VLLGHYGIALAAKRAAPRTSLGALNFAAQLLDELWPIFVLMGLETVRVAPGLMAANSLDFVHYPITHSLLGALGWSVLLGVLYFATTRYRRGGWWLDSWSSATGFSICRCTARIFRCGLGRTFELGWGRGGRFP